MIPTLTVGFLSGTSPEEAQALFDKASCKVVGTLALLGSVLYTVTAEDCSIEEAADFLRGSGKCKLVEVDRLERIGPRS